MEREKKEAELAARGGRRRWSGLRDTEEVGESDEKSRSRVDLEMNNDETRYPECSSVHGGRGRGRGRGRQYQQVHAD
jgi:hypothetical protein